MATAARDHYLVPRRLVHTFGALVVLFVVAVPLVAWLTAPSWLPRVPALLDEDQPIAAPDVVALKASGESDEAVRQAARPLREGRVRQVAIFGVPFTPDNLVMPQHSRRYQQLLQQGVPAGSIVEISQGDDIYEEMEAMRDAAQQRGWRRVLFYADGPGSRRNLVAARRILGEAGIAVGQTTFPAPWFDARTWWRPGQARTIVFVRAVQLGFTLVSNRT
jgi:uncharacterized SAM-binding protein YcdF (DUF218 family)